jgi:excisionase family DNA binding protein
MAEPEVLDAYEAADLLGAHVETVRRLARRGDIPSFKLGSEWRFSREALRRWFSEQRPREAPAVLVVDDDPRVLRSLTRMIERLGCRAQGAANGPAALELVERSAPDLILLDLQMPGMNGPELLDRLRPRHPDLPVVIVTGHPDSDLMQRASQHAPIMVLPKPTHATQIERTVRAVLGDRLPARTAEART